MKKHSRYLAAPATDAAPLVLEPGGFGRVETWALADYLAREQLARPFGPGDVVLASQGETPKRLTRDDAAAMLAGQPLGREVARCQVPRGHVALLAVSDARTWLRVVPVADLPPPRLDSITADEPAAPPWRTTSTRAGGAT